MNRGVKTAGVALGVAAGVVGAGYAAQRALLRSLRHRPDPDAGRLRALPVEGSRHLPGHDGGSLYVVSTEDTLGENEHPKILFSHGVMIDSRVWMKQFQSLPRQGVECLAFDHRGHGQSVCGDTRPSLENLATDLRTVIEGLDLRDLVVVGHSMGGVAVQAFLNQFPEVARERVRGIVLLSSLAKTQLSTSQHLKAIVEQVAGGLNIGGAVARPNLGTMLTRLGFGRDVRASHVELNRQMLMECDPEIGREGVNLLLGLDLTADVSNIKLPTLVISGTHDILTPPKEARRLAQLIPDAELVMFERAGHMIMLERADEFDALLLDFAREVGILPAGSARAAGATAG